MPVVSRRAQEALYPSDRANRGMVEFREPSALAALPPLFALRAANVMAVIAESRENNGSTHNTTVSSPKASWPMQ